MKMLVACEYSSTVRKAFEDVGFDAYSCDLLSTEGDPDKHFKCDVLDILNDGWDLLVGHPPCTDLAVSGAGSFKHKQMSQPQSVWFFNRLWEANIPRICLENPVSIIGQYIGKATQTIQPWMFGHGECKATCLWLKNLPKLVPTCPVAGREQRVWKMGPSKDRSKERARFSKGIAEAMAAQWGLTMLAGTIDL